MMDATRIIQTFFKSILHELSHLHVSLSPGVSANLIEIIIKCALIEILPCTKLFSCQVFKKGIKIYLSIEAAATANVQRMTTCITKTLIPLHNYIAFNVHYRLALEIHYFTYSSYHTSDTTKEKEKKMTIKARLIHSKPKLLPLSPNLVNKQQQTTQVSSLPSPHVT